MTKYILFLLLPLFPFLALAENKELPGELYYQDAPIEPYCFYSIYTSSMGEESSTPKEIDIASCTESIRKLEITDDERGGNERGFRGMTFNDEYDKGAFVLYKYIGKIKDNMVVELMVNGGGSGIFSMIIYLKREGDFLKIIDVENYGDRCLGGIKNSKIEDDQLVTALYISPIDFFGIVSPNSNFDVAYCMGCCIGIAEYKSHILQSIEFNNKNIDEMQQGKYQQCFNQLYKDYLAKGKTKITPDEAKEFVNIFTKQCVK
ncbi:MAG: hypothetical protein ACK4OM_03420 [Alphaproteobacteria bacterium]